MQIILDELREAVAVCQCCEDATEEEHLRITLGMVNGMLLAVIAELEYLQREATEERTEASGM